MNWRKEEWRNSYNAKRFKKNKERLLPFETIKAATEGDVDAMDKILKHYKPYIVKLSIRTDGDKSYIDEDLRERLEAKLIAKTLNLRLLSLNMR